MSEELTEWLSEQCQRLKYGQCTTRRCLVRGGYTGPPMSADIATCEPYEVSLSLAKLDEMREALKLAERRSLQLWGLLESEGYNVEWELAERFAQHPGTEEEPHPGYDCGGTCVIHHGTQGEKQ